MSVRLVMTLDANLEDIVGAATRIGFKRSRPSSSWTDLERREAARYYVNALVNHHLKEHERLSLQEIPK